MQSATLPPDTVPTRTEQLAERVRDDIVRDVFPAGTRVTEEALAERYGVSRTPVREALRMLAREHLLVYAPRAGYTVAAVNLDEMDDLYTVRVSIEERVAGRFEGFTGDTAMLRSLLAQWEGEHPHHADVNLVFADEAFHEALAAASGSTVLPPMLRNINQRLHALRIRDFVDAERVRLTFEQHAAIARALLDRDTRLAQALLRGHIWQSYAFVRSSLLREEVTP